MRSGCKLVATPESPDISVYITALEARILGLPLERVLARLRLSAEDSGATTRVGRGTRGARAPPHWKAHRHRRRGQFSAPTKGPVVEDPGRLWLVLHLMIAGRLHWKAPGAKLAGGTGPCGL